MAATFPQTLLEMTRGLDRCGDGCLAHDGCPERGRFPRCVFAEPGMGSRPTMVVGKNPGQATAKEQKRFAEARTPEDLACASASCREADVHPYYVGLKSFLCRTDRDGPIWWTECA